jgi:ELP3 family radical SAM enzyme/protein acetyltransferase
MDIEELIKNIDQYADITIAFYKHYIDNPDLSFDKLLKNTLKTHSYKKKLSKIILRKSYLTLIEKGILELNSDLIKLLIKKPSRSDSGIQSVSILTSPYPKWVDDKGEEYTQNFSCKHNCYFCPDERDEKGTMIMPRSYLSKEPACRRGLRNNFDPIEQIYDRLYSLENQGHPLDKIELIVLGGTVLEYPREYLTYFTTQCFYICNIYPLKKGRTMLTLEEEQLINVTTNIKIIGITLETRPDGINHESIHFLRTLGVTRMQIGIQHTNNTLLKKVNRGHTIEDSIHAIKLLKNSGLKIISHLMPDLPFSNEEDDMDMFKQILTDPDVLCDEYKIYPCVATDFTTIQKWAKAGKYVSNVDRDPKYLHRVIGYYMKNVQPWVRVPRIIRDIPNDYISHGNKQGHLRQIIDKQNPESNEIRGREIKNTKLTDKPVMLVDKFVSSEATEYFIRYVTHDKENILGFCRLRLPTKIDNPFLPELYNSAIIRELHVYGKTTIVNKKSGGVQHLGLGQKLVKKAEWIALQNGYIDVCITSGIGVREYYKNKLGYHLEGMYMKKNVFIPILFQTILLISILTFISLCMNYY